MKTTRKSLDEMMVDGVGRSCGERCCKFSATGSTKNLLESPREILTSCCETDSYAKILVSRSFRSLESTHAREKSSFLILELLLIGATDPCSSYSFGSGRGPSKYTKVVIHLSSDCSKTRDFCSYILTILRGPSTMLNLRLSGNMHSSSSFPVMSYISLTL